MKTISNLPLEATTEVRDDFTTAKDVQEPHLYKTFDGFMSRFLLILESVATILMLGGFVFCVMNVHKFSGWAAVGTFACSIICFSVSCFFWKTLPRDARRIFNRFPVKSYDECEEDK